MCGNCCKYLELSKEFLDLLGLHQPDGDAVTFASITDVQEMLALLDRMDTGLEQADEGVSVLGRDRGCASQALAAFKAGSTGNVLLNRVGRQVGYGQGQDASGNIVGAPIARGVSVHRFALGKATMRVYSVKVAGAPELFDAWGPML